MINEMI